MLGRLPEAEADTGLAVLPRCGLEIVKVVTRGIDDCRAEVSAQRHGRSGDRLVYAAECGQSGWAGTRARVEPRTASRPPIRLSPVLSNRLRIGIGRGIRSLSHGLLQSLSVRLSDFYRGSMACSEWPKRATAETYRRYALRTSWYVEAAASLVAGFEPRRNISYFPIPGKPQAPDGHFVPEPYTAAPTWYDLLQETAPVGQILAIYEERTRGSFRIPGAGLISPVGFLEFCEDAGIPIRGG